MKEPHDRKRMKLNERLDIAQKLLVIIAALLAAAWALFQLVLREDLSGGLSVDVEAHQIHVPNDDNRYLLLSAQLQATRHSIVYDLRHACFAVTGFSISSNQYTATSHAEYQIAHPSGVTNSMVQFGTEIASLTPQRPRTLQRLVLVPTSGLYYASFTAGMQGVDENGYATMKRTPIASDARVQGAVACTAGRYVVIQ